MGVLIRLVPFVKRNKKSIANVLCPNEQIELQRLETNFIRISNWNISRYEGQI